MPSLSVLIPARNEMFLLNTVQDVLKNLRGDTDIIVVLDGQWPVEPIPDHPRVHLIYQPESIGQRAAVNLAARVSRSDYVMKLDAHCAMDDGFDVKLMQPYEDGELDRTVTTMPRLYNLHVFDWVCEGCGRRTYQGPEPKTCVECHGTAHHRDIVWKPRLNRMTDHMRFDNTMHFQYWSSFKHRPESKNTDFPELLGNLGACIFMRRDRFWELGGMDERHGSWGQYGTETSCKAWLSGGRQVTNRRTWYSHLFRTQPGFGFPYKLSEKQAEHARQHSRKLWLENTWEGQTRPLLWLIDHFWPVDGWTEADRDQLRVQAHKFAARRAPKSPSVGCVYYTDSQLEPTLATACRTGLQRAVNGHALVSVSLEPLDFGRNIVLPLERGRLSMFKQILAGLEALDTTYACLCEHDCLYPPEHFQFVPPREDRFYYNQNVWRVNVETGQAVTYDMMSVSGCCASRQLLVDYYRALVAEVEQHGYDHARGYEAGVREGLAVGWRSTVPYLDLRHGQNLTASRWSPEAFRDKRTCQHWHEAGTVPGWGTIQGRFPEWLREVVS